MRNFPESWASSTLWAFPPPPSSSFLHLLLPSWWNTPHPSSSLLCSFPLSLLLKALKGPLVWKERQWFSFNGIIYNRKKSLKKEKAGATVLARGLTVEPFFSKKSCTLCAFSWPAGKLASAAEDAWGGLWTDAAVAGSVVGLVSAVSSLHEHLSSLIRGHQGILSHCSVFRWYLSK